MKPLTCERTHRNLGACSFAGCGRAQEKKGLCRTHYHHRHLGHKLAPIKSMAKGATVKVTACIPVELFLRLTQNIKEGKRSAYIQRLLELDLRRREYAAQLHQGGDDDD